MDKMILTVDGRKQTPETELTLILESGAEVTIEVDEREAITALNDLAQISEGIRNEAFDMMAEWSDDPDVRQARLIPIKGKLFQATIKFITTGMAPVPMWYEWYFNSSENNMLRGTEYRVGINLEPTFTEVKAIVQRIAKLPLAMMD